MERNSLNWLHVTLWKPKRTLDCDSVVIVCNRCDFWIKFISSYLILSYHPGKNIPNHIISVNGNLWRSLRSRANITSRKLIRGNIFVRHFESQEKSGHHVRAGVKYVLWNTTTNTNTKICWFCKYKYKYFVQLWFKYKYKTNTLIQIQIQVRSTKYIWWNCWDPK